MRKAGIVILSVFLLAMACGKKAPQPRYAPDSKEYDFFKKLSDKVPVLNPDESNELISTKKFSVYTGDIMPNIYRMWSRYANNFDRLPEERVTAFVHQAATQEAEKKLLLAAAANNHISVSQDTVEAELQKIYASRGGEEAFIKGITAQGITIDFVKEDVQNSMTVQKYLNDIVFDNIPVDDEEIKDAYEQDKTATVRHILMKTQNKSDSVKQEIRKKMEGILAQARAGEDFAELAKQYSEDPGSKDKGGLYENFTRGRMVKTFEDASFDLPIGSISDLVETQYGYHIVKVVSRSKETRPYDEVKDEIRKKLAESKKQDTFRSLMDSLKEEFEYQELFKA